MKKINFPISYDLKIIMECSESDERNKCFIIDILNELNISFGGISTRPSSAGTYTGFTIPIIIENEEMFKALYENLKKLPNIKSAI